MPAVKQQPFVIAISSPGFSSGVETPEHLILARLRRKRYTPGDLLPPAPLGPQIQRIVKRIFGSPPGARR